MMRVAFTICLLLATSTTLAYQKLSQTASWEGVTGYLYEPVQAGDSYGNTYPYVPTSITNGAKVAIVGMSNTMQEWGQTLQSTAWSHFRTLSVAQGGIDVNGMDSPSDGYWTTVQQRLELGGENYNQINVVIVKNFHTGSKMMSYGDFPQDQNNAVTALCTDYGLLVDTIKTKFPNLKRLLFQDRTYAEYLTDGSGERWYETHFAIRCAIKAKNVVTGPKDANGLYPVQAPSIGWFNEIYDPTMTGADFEGPNNVHPNSQGEGKIATINLNAAQTQLTFPYLSDLVELRMLESIGKVSTFSYDLTAYPNGNKPRRVQFRIDGNTATGTCTINRQGLPSKTMNSYARGGVIQIIHMSATSNTGSISCTCSGGCLIDWRVVGQA